jgi:CRP/FNR family cyclic AMP-dependent transcriptional regulator
MKETGPRRRPEEDEMYTTQVPMLLPGSLSHLDTASPADWARVLATFPLFAGVSRRRLRNVVRHATVAEHSRGDIVIQRGESGDWLYVILSGSASTRGRKAARTLGTGDYFGELALLGAVPRTATVVATSELHVMRFPRKSVLGLLKAAPDISLKMLNVLGSQFRQLESQAA